MVYIFAASKMHWRLSMRGEVDRRRELEMTAGARDGVCRR
jgi:hypothetical protein